MTEQQLQLGKGGEQNLFCGKKVLSRAMGHCHFLAFLSLVHWLRYTWFKIQYLMPSVKDDKTAAKNNFVFLTNGMDCKTDSEQLGKLNCCSVWRCKENDEPNLYITRFQGTALKIG